MPSSFLMWKASGLRSWAVAGGAGSTVGSGGMITKIKAARVLMVAGIPMVICYGRQPHVVEDAAAGKAVGTRFSALEKPHEITPRKLWIALGRLGARRGGGRRRCEVGAHRARQIFALRGVAGVEGRFEAGDIVDIKDLAGHLFARGRAAFSADEVELACGKTLRGARAQRLLAALTSVRWCTATSWWSSNRGLSPRALDIRQNVSRSCWNRKCWRSRRPPRMLARRSRRLPRRSVTPP